MAGFSHGQDGSARGRLDPAQRRTEHEEEGVQAEGRGDEYYLDLVRELSVSRAWLASLGISGEVVKTDGHGDGHACPVLEDGTAYSGDIPPEAMVGGYDARTKANWETLRAMGVRRVLPAHGEAYRI
jgi:glyoxylase-like metal-dependent hydrolase (beta-lactamase superfamily II)